MAEGTAGLNLVLLGITGVGKSASGNTILGREAFTSKKSSTSVTQELAVESGIVCGRWVTVYDTPGLFNTHRSDEEIQQIYADVLQRCESDPCVFLLVIKPDRFTGKERKTVEKIEELLGEERLKKTWILFTRGDELEEENMTIDEFINLSKPLKILVQKYDQRYHVFNNKTKGPSDQARLLLVNIQRSLGSKGESYCTFLVEYPDPDTPADSLSSRRIVLLGRTGAGKSAAGNTILGREEFISSMSTRSIASECSDAHTTVSGRSVSVVDTPGLYHTEMEIEELMMEIARSVYISSPGPHAFLIVFPVYMRVTDHDQQIPQLIEMMFGEEVFKYSIILFTHGDLLEGYSVEELVEENRRLRDLVQRCGGRFHVFNNRDVNNRDQVNDLLKKIDTIIEQNGGGHYSHQMPEDAHRFRQEEEQVEEEIEIEIEEKFRVEMEWRKREERQKDCCVCS
ncbi:hypothetical protein PO909_000815 [Leuciscus waleckii]